MNAPRLEIVVDTNVVLDCWVFDDPATRPLAAALAGGHAIQWVATAAMLAELQGVLQRPLSVRWEPARVQALARSPARWAEVVGDPPPLAAAALRCSDTADQKFIDLAVHRSARWLLTHDRALLKLARAARRHGVAIAEPGAWRP